MKPFEDIRLGLECCLVGECKHCPFNTIPDKRRCRASLHDNVGDLLAQMDELRRERDRLADECYDLEEALRDLEEAEG